jgi:hypothetical protein
MGTERVRRAAGRGVREACLLCAGPVQERHHVAGKRLDAELAAPLCTACHERGHRDLEEAGVHLDTAHRGDLLARLVAWLRSLGQFLLSLGERCLEWARELERSLAAGGTG